VRCPDKDSWQRLVLVFLLLLLLLCHAITWTERIDFAVEIVISLWYRYIGKSQRKLHSEIDSLRLTLLRKRPMLVLLAVAQ
jgi:O-antigen ligase